MCSSPASTVDILFRIQQYIIARTRPVVNVLNIFQVKLRFLGKPTTYLLPACIPLPLRAHTAEQTASLARLQSKSIRRKSDPNIAWESLSC